MTFNFNDKDTLPAGVIVIASVVAALGLCGFAMFVPKPTTAGLTAKRNKQEAQIIKDTAKAKNQFDEVKSHVDGLVWQLPVADVGPKAMELVTKLADARKLKVVAFRPQRAIDIKQLTSLPFLVTVDGAFPAVQGFIMDLEATGNRLALSQVQLSSAEGTSNRVTASISLVAYAYPKKEASKAEVETASPKTAPIAGTATSGTTTPGASK